MKRLGALVGAVAMVAVAMLARGAFTADDGDGGTGGSAGSPRGLVCPTELADVCRAAGGRVVDATAGDTADALIGATGDDVLDGEAWIVPAAWARLVLDERERLGMAARFAIDGDPLASSGVALTVWGDRADELSGRCGTAVSWSCLADQAGATLDRGDRVRPAEPDVDSASGLTVAAAQAADLLGTTDFAANDFSDAFRTRAGRLAVGQLDQPLLTMRREGPGRVTAAGVLVVDATNLASSFGSIQPVFDAGPPVRADVVALVRAGEDLDAGLRAGLTDAFADAGWDPAADGADGLPAGGVLAAIRTLWNDNR